MSFFDDFGSFLGNFAGEVSGVADEFSHAIRTDQAAIQGASQALRDAYGSVLNSVDVISSSIDPNGWNYNGYDVQNTPLPDNGNTLEIPQQTNPNANVPAGGSATNPLVLSNPEGSFYPSSDFANRTPVGTPTNIPSPSVVTTDYSGLNPPSTPNIRPAFWDTYNSSPFAGSSGILVLGGLLLAIVYLAGKRA